MHFDFIGKINEIVENRNFGKLILGFFKLLILVVQYVRKHNDILLISMAIQYFLQTRSIWIYRVDQKKYHISFAAKNAFIFL